MRISETVESTDLELDNERNEERTLERPYTKAQVLARPSNVGKKRLKQNNAFSSASNLTEMAFSFIDEMAKLFKNSRTRLLEKVE